MNIKRKEFPIKIKEVSKQNGIKLKLKQFPPPHNMKPLYLSKLFAKAKKKSKFWVKLEQTSHCVFRNGRTDYTM